MNRFSRFLHDCILWPILWLLSAAIILTVLGLMIAVMYVVVGGGR